MTGTVVFDGKTHIGHGSRIAVSDNAELRFGSNFACTANMSLICFTRIVFGEDVLISWETMIMDTDFHYIQNLNDSIKSNLKPISIGNHVWIGCRSTILKGCVIGNDCVVAAGTVCSKQYPLDGVLIAGNPATVKAENIKWYESLPTEALC